MSTRQRITRYQFTLLFAITLWAAVNSFGQEYQPDAYTVALWHLDGNWKDASSNGHDLTVSGNPQFILGCPQVQGSTNAVPPHLYYSVSDPDLIYAGGIQYPGSGGWTIECWVKFDHLFHQFPENRGMMIHQYTPGIAGHEPFELGIRNGQLYFHIQSASNQVLSVTVDASPYVGQWIHIAGVYEPGKIKLYVNGNLVAEKTGNVVPESRTANFYICSQWDFSHGHSWDFHIDEVRISNKARDPSEFNVGPTGGLNLTFNQIDASGFPTIDCYVTVTDDQGNPISGLNESNFTVKEDGHTESPITVTPMGAGAVPIAVALVIDRSGSMGLQPLDDAKTAAITFVNQMGSNDKAAVISFSSDVRVDQPFTSDKSLLINAINSLTSGGFTAMYDAVIKAVNQTNTQTGRKAIILMTDGADNASSSSLQDAINTAVQSNIPVFTIGLGLTAEQDLQQIADSTGGRYYYAPSSSDLQQIYQLISQQLQNQYKITYTTHNPNRDGTTRTVRITANYQGNTDTKSRTYVAPTGGGVAIFPTATSPQLVGNEFWVDIKVGDASNPVNNLFGVSFVLNFTHTNYIDVVTPHSSNVIPGSFMGSDLVFYQAVDEGAGKISVGISRKAGQGGVSGSGTVLRVKFVARSNTPNGTQVQFSISDVTANDPNGAPITLNPASLTITIQAGVAVWPGDTNNDGVVNQADVLPIGLYWNSTGPARQNASMSWTAQYCQPWTPLAATYADATGDGVVNQADVLPIGLNWGKTHTVGSLASLYRLEKIRSPQTPTIKPEVNPSQQAPNQEFFIRIKVSEVNDLFGLAFELLYDRPDLLQILSVETDDFFGSDVVFYSNVEASAGKVVGGISRKAGQGGISGTGSVVRVKARISSTAPASALIHLSLQNVVANDSNGSPMDLSIQSSNIVVGVSDVDSHEEMSLPTGYRLYQNHPNPFNAGTLIRYEISQATQVEVKVFNFAGQEIRTLVKEFQQPGYYQISWDARDEQGQRVSSGVYFCRLQAGSFVQSRKMILLR